MKALRQYFTREGKYSYSEWLTLLANHFYLCFWCGRPLSEKAAYRDHLQPISRGGLDYLSNIVPACNPCNSAKGNKNEQEFRNFLAQQFHRRAGDLNRGVYKTITELSEQKESSWAWKNRY